MIISSIWINETSASGLYDFAIFNSVAPCSRRDIHPHRLYSTFPKNAMKHCVFVICGSPIYTLFIYTCMCRPWPQVQESVMAVESLNKGSNKRFNRKEVQGKRSLVHKSKKKRRSDCGDVFACSSHNYTSATIAAAPCTCIERCHSAVWLTSSSHNSVCIYSILEATKIFT